MNRILLASMLFLISCVQAQDPNDQPDYSRVPTTAVESLPATPKDFWLLGTDNDPTTTNRVIGKSIGIPSEAVDLLSGYLDEGFHRLLSRIEGATIVSTSTELAAARDDPTTTAIGIYGWILIDQDFTDGNALTEDIPVLFLGDSGFQFGPVFKVEINGPVVARPHVKIFRDAIYNPGNKPSVFGTFSGVPRYLGWWCQPYPHQTNHDVSLQAAIDSFLFTTLNVIDNTIERDWKGANSDSTTLYYSGMLNIFHGGIFLTNKVILQNRELWFKGSGAGSLFRFEDFEIIGAVSWDEGLDTLTLSAGTLADGDRVQLKVPYGSTFAAQEAAVISRGMNLRKTYEVINFVAGTFQLADVDRDVPVDITLGVGDAPTLSVEKCQANNYQFAFDIQTVTPGLKFEDCTIAIGQSCSPDIKIFNLAPGGFMEPSLIQGNYISVEYGANLLYAFGSQGMNHMSFNRNYVTYNGITSEPIISGTIVAADSADFAGDIANSRLNIATALAGVNIETWFTPLIAPYAIMTILEPGDNAGDVYHIREIESEGSTLVMMDKTHGNDMTFPADIDGDPFEIHLEQYCGVIGLTPRQRTMIHLNNVYETKLNVGYNTFIGGEYGVLADETRTAAVHLLNNHWENTHTVVGIYGSKAASFIMHGDRFSDFRDDDKIIFKNATIGDLTYDVQVTANRQSNGNPVALVYDAQHNGQASESNQKIGPTGVMAAAGAVHGMLTANVVSSKAGYSLHTSAVDAPYALFTLLLQPANNDVINIGLAGNTTTYTFKTSPLSSGPTVPYEVLIGLDTTETSSNLEAAVERNSGEGTVYGQDTPIHNSFYIENEGPVNYVYWKLQEPTVPTTWEISGTFVTPGTISDPIYPVFDWATSPAKSIGQALGLDRFWRAAESTHTGDGTIVTSWDDVMGSGKNWTPAVAPDNPTYDADGLYGQPAVRFDGTDWFQMINSNMFPNLEGACFFVIKFDDNPVNTEYVFHTGLDGGHSFNYSSSLDAMIFFSTSGAPAGTLSVQSPIVQKEFKDFACLVAWDQGVVPPWSSDSRGTMWGANKYNAAFIGQNTLGQEVIAKTSTLAFGLGSTSIGASPMKGHIADVAIWHTRPNRATIRKALGYINARYDLSIPFELDP